MIGKKQKAQIDAWTESDEHNKVIELLSALPSSEMDFEATGLLARAYNNIDEYGKALELLDTFKEEGHENVNWNFRIGYSLFFLGRFKESLSHFEKANELEPEDEDTLYFIRECNLGMPFRARVNDFWKWFTENEPELSHIIENRSNQDDSNRIIELVSQGTDLISKDAHFNLGGDYEFTFCVEGRISLFYLYPYLVSQLPEQFSEKWHFFPFNPGTDHTFTFDMYGVQVDMANVQVSAAYVEENNCFNIRYYEPQLATLPVDESLNAYYIMMEIMLGEGLSYQYIADVERTDVPAEHMITLPELKAYITDTLKARDKEVFDNPKNLYTGYRLEPEESEELRFDIIAGTTCFAPLLANYYSDLTEQFDALAKFGVKAAYIAFSYDSEEGDNGKEILDFRHTLEDRIEQELLQPEGLGLMLGGAIGQSVCYIDLLLFDQRAFTEKIIPLLSEYPRYKFYLSGLRQHSELEQLSETACMDAIPK